MASNRHFLFCPCTLVKCVFMDSSEWNHSIVSFKLLPSASLTCMYDSRCHLIGACSAWVICPYLEASIPLNFLSSVEEYCTAGFSVTPEWSSKVWRNKWKSLFIAPRWLSNQQPYLYPGNPTAIVSNQSASIPIYCNWKWSTTSLFLYRFLQLEQIDSMYPHHGFDYFTCKVAMYRPISLWRKLNNLYTQLRDSGTEWPTRKSNPRHKTLWSSWCQWSKTWRIISVETWDIWTGVFNRGSLISTTTYLLYPELAGTTPC